MHLILDFLDFLRGLVGLRSAQGRMRASAGHWIELGERVWHYRRDQLNESENRELLGGIEALRQARRNRMDSAQLKLRVESLEATLSRIGGAAYRRSGLVENVEFFVVAAIVIFGIRTYFVQPFKIPTNSMWPSYFGMTAHVYKEPAAVPDGFERALRFLAFGAKHYEVVAPASGPISIPVTSDGRLHAVEKPGKKWFILPALVDEYTFMVGDRPVRVTVPTDFNEFDVAFRDALGLSQTELMAAARRAERQAAPGARWVTLDRQAEAGKPFFVFDLLTGDQLFVDRFSYHFFAPKVGQGFVFRTGDIPGIAALYGDQYYIKRLVGVGGDELEIRPPELWRNGRPIEGSTAFEKSARQIDRYPGYSFGPTGESSVLQQGERTAVPDGQYLALGDNSPLSYDGRYWGFVPESSVIGKPLFVYYPLTSRWGLRP